MWAVLAQRRRRIAVGSIDRRTGTFGALPAGDAQKEVSRCEN
jgi:hypothetical protein